MSAIDWLLEYGGPVVQYRTASELLKDAALAESLSKELHRFEFVRRWFSYLPSRAMDRRLFGKGIQGVSGMGFGHTGPDRLPVINGGSRLAVMPPLDTNVTLCNT